MKLIWDKVVKGLHTKTNPNGKQSYFLYYRTRGGQQRRPKIGDIPTFSLQDARKVARELLVQVSMGKDPSRNFEVLKAEPTIKELFCSTWNNHWSKERFQNSRWGYEVKRNYDNHIHPFLGSFKISELKASKIREWHKTFEDIPIAGNRSLNILSTMYKFAEQMELIPQNTNPCNLITHFVEKKRKRFATMEEIETIGQILNSYYTKYPRGVSFIYLLMLTGARPRSIERATWNNLKTVDGHGVLEFSGKMTESTGESETIIFSPSAMKIIEPLRELGTATITGVKTPTKLWS
jgi:integrase